MEKKTIYCPWCKRAVMRFNTKMTINPDVKCRKCGKIIVYDIQKEKAVVKNVPQRQAASGTRLY